MGQRKKKTWDIKSRMMFGFMSLLAAMSIIISALFIHTRATMCSEYKKLVRGSVESVVEGIDNLVREIYNVSDNFAASDQLNEWIEKEYTPQQSALKKADTIRLYNQIFSTYDMLQKRQKIGAIYTAKGVLFNFEDANWDGQEVIKSLQQLGVNDKDHLMRFYWYPLQKNFFISKPYGDVRKDKIVIGSRRVYSVWKSAYVCTHIFILREEELYKAYKENVVETKGDIYIVDQEGRLISSSNASAVSEGEIELSLRKMVENRSEDEFIWKNGRQRMQVCVRQSELNQWLSIAVIPEKSITGEVDILYIRIFMVLIICMLFCCAMFLLLYRSFINPINELNSAMKEVDAGNLNAYVKESGRYEIANMMRYYNSMLKSIHIHVVEKLESERKKKELELDVLMSQINPHFLYNTLETIVWKSNEAGDPDIGRLAASLGRMYRLSISSGQIIVPLQHEIEHLMAYVKIQKNRYEDAFDIDLRTDMRMVRQLYILKILLQPIVENSFLHGMEGLERKMIIRLKMQIEENFVEIKVIDNGIGMDKRRLEQVREQICSGHREGEQENHRGTGIGLHNVAARISLYFGLEDPVRIYSKNRIGTMTVLRLPKLTVEDIDDNGELKNRM